MTSNSKATSSIRLPSLYRKTLIKSEFDYRRDLRRKLERIQHDNRDLMRRHFANDHVFAHELLTKRHQWFGIDKSYRDTCRTMWNRQAALTSRTSHTTQTTSLSFYPSESYTPTSLISASPEEDDSVLADEKIREDFLCKQPVMIEIMVTPHASQSLKQKQEIELRKKSAQNRHTQIQKTAVNDNRYRQLVNSLQDP